MTLPNWRRRQLREKHAPQHERAHDQLGAVAGVSESSLSQHYTSAFWQDSQVYCRDCVDHAGRDPLAVTWEADHPCAHCQRPLGDARLHPTRARR